MPQASNKVRWCLSKAQRELEESNIHRGLVKVEGNIELANRHITKAEHNLKAALYFEMSEIAGTICGTLVRSKPAISEHAQKHAPHFSAGSVFDKGGFSDWSASAFFYCIYHCFLAILRKFGYESRNQECTIAVIEMLKEEGKIEIDETFIDALKIEKAEERHESSIIKLRENFQYSSDLDFKEKEEFNKIVGLCKEAINKTRDII